MLFARDTSIPILLHKTRIASPLGHKLSPEEALAMMVGMNPHGRLITTDEVAAAVAWICAPSSDSYDGQALEYRVETSNFSLTTGIPFMNCFAKSCEKWP